MAARTRASIEVKHYHGDHILLAFLDCSKSYERVGHALAGARALQSGLAARVANMAFDMYKGHRYVKVHGAVARPRTGGHGPVAGCAFAKDMLKALLAPIKEECPRGKPRDYIDDINYPRGRRTHGGSLRRRHARGTGPGLGCAGTGQHGAE